MFNIKGENRKQKCLHCSKYIDLKKDHLVRISTLNRISRGDHDDYFHFACWINYFNSRVENKMKANIQFMQKKALSLFNSPALSSVLGNLQGTEMLGKMLNFPVYKTPTESKEEIKPDLKEEIKSKIKNGKNKRSGKTRKKAKMHKV